MASIAARATTPAVYLAPLRVSRGMAASSHLPALLSAVVSPLASAQRGPYDEIERRPRVRPRAGRCCARSAPQAGRYRDARSARPAHACGRSWKRRTRPSPAYIAQLRETGNAPARPRRSIGIWCCRNLSASSAAATGGLDHVRRPLLLFGAADSAFPPALTNHLLRSYQAYADHVGVAFVPGAAHFMADERPDVVVDRALKFFAGPSRQVDLP